MFHRLTLSTALLLCLAVSASSQNILPSPDPKLVAAARMLKLKDYRGARESTLSASNRPEKELIAGVAAYRLGEWAEAIPLLDRAAVELPIIADYPLFWKADALFQTGRLDEALETVKRLLRDWPESPLLRRGRLLQADILFARKDFREAHSAYLKFVETYPTGNDSITALYQAALCREGMGEERKAVQEIRGIWLTYPASPVAEKAEEKLRELAARGFVPPPYTADELLRRANTLYGLGRYREAVKAFDAIPLADEPPDFINRVDLKRGQALYRARRYKDAERTFAQMLKRELKPALAEETRFWQAKALDRSDRSEEAFAVYLSIASASPPGELADEALLEAALIRKFQGRYREEHELLERLLKLTSDEKLRKRGTWEAAWALYVMGEFKRSSDLFKNLQNAGEYRERALYWHGRALEEAGERDGAASSFSILREEFPLSFYGLKWGTEKEERENFRSPPPDPLSTLPMPAGYERIKLLIAVGLHDEARRELTNARKKVGSRQKSLQELARLHLEMEDYASAAAIYRDSIPRRISDDTLTQWSILYPRPFRDTVKRLSSDQGIAEELVYAIMKAESSFSPTVVSPAGAVGLMQVMPATAAAMVDNRDKSNISSRLTDPPLNITLGLRHLKGLLQKYNGDVIMAVAAYNAGSTPVDRWRRNLPFRRDDEFIENIPYLETREYVKKVLTNAAIYRRLYGKNQESDSGTGERESVTGTNKKS